jgi:hypothetical protein
LPDLALNLFLRLGGHVELSDDKVFINPLPGHVENKAGDETLSVAAMHVCNPDRSHVGIQKVNRNRAGSRLLFLAEFLESGIAAQWVPERIEP